MNDKFIDFMVSVASANECVEDIFSLISKHAILEKKQAWLACLNPHSFVVSRSDNEFRDALKNAKWLIPDGIGVVIGSRLLLGKINRRVTGYDVFVKLSRLMNSSKNIKVFFMGSSDSNLANLRKKYEVDFPNIKIVGCYSPPFREEYSCAENEVMINMINQSCADVVWVAMTAPKQEKWIYKNIDRLYGVSFVGAVGAVFDFYTGNVKRSPKFFRQIGLEWLPRLISQPVRLWRRTFISAPIFLCCVVKEYLLIKIKKIS